MIPSANYQALSNQIFSLIHYFLRIYLELWNNFSLLMEKALEKKYQIMIAKIYMIDNNFDSFTM